MAERITIIDYGSGNLHSVQKAIERAAAETGLAADILVTADREVVAEADRVVLPGVGAFAACREGLDGLDGMTDTLREVVLEKKQPFLGICVGMQLLASRSHEFGQTLGLDWISGDVRRFDLPGEYRVPHIGWNDVRAVSDHPALRSMGDGGVYYFVHSYHFEAENESDIAALCDYGDPFVAAVARDNLVGLQFHPEKSQGAGVALLKDFLNWRP